MNVKPEFREPTEFERLLIERLLEADFPGRDELATLLRDVLVRNIDVDGSLSLGSRTEGKAPANSHPNFLEVAWQDQPDMKEFPTVVFPMRTVAEISRDEYRNLAEGIQPMSKPATEATDQNEFVLEKYLEEFIVTNFDAIFKKELKIFQDTEGNRGQQFETDIGTIDILAVERHSDSFVVIELKKGRPSDQVIGQALRYMGWVKKNLCKTGQHVRGLVICRDPDPKLSYALSMAQNIEVQYYSVSFKLDKIPDPTVEALEQICSK